MECWIPITTHLKIDLKEKPFKKSHPHGYGLKTCFGRDMVGSVNVDTAKMDRIVVVQTTHFIQLGVIQP